MRSPSPRRRLLRAPLLLLFLLFSVVDVFTPGAMAQVITVKNPQALPVLDNAKILTADQVSSLSARLLNLAQTDGTQVALLVVPTTGDEDIFMFSQRTATEWGIGQKDNNNGALMVVAVNDRKVRIHVGYGLEGRLTDGLSKRIIEREILPEFRRNNYAGGISRGVDAIIAAVRGEYKAPPAKSEQSGGRGIVAFLIMAFFIYMVFKGGRGGRGGRRGPGLIFLPDLWTTGGHRSGGWSSGGGGGGFGGGFGGGGFGGGGASGGW